MILIVASVLVAIAAGVINNYNMVSNSQRSMALYEKSLRDSYDQNIRAVTQQAISTLNGIYQQEQQGKLTEAQAKQTATAVMTNMRYGDDGEGYFWGDTTGGVCVFHGSDQSVVGTNRNNAQDAKGNYYIQEIRKAALGGGGYIAYWFPKPDSQDTAQYPKRAYALEFQPWQWVIGTGNYIDEIDKAVAQRQAAVDQENKIGTIYSAGGMLLVILTAIVFSLRADRKLTRRLEPMVETAMQVAQGRLSVAQVKAGGDDVIGHLGQSLNTMTANLRELVTKVKASSDKVASTSSELSSGAEQSAQASNQISAAIETVFKGTEKQLEVVEKSKNAINGISSSIDKTLGYSRKAVSTSEKAAESALQGSQAVDETVKQMTNIEKTATASAEVIRKLGDESQEISQIVDMISGIAAQTNLLALNAAIEAARAGEQGKGFAVVAEEIRKLAEQSGQATQQIADLISAVQSNTQRAVVTIGEETQQVSLGTEIVRNTGRTFQEISDLVNTALSQIREISAEIQQTADGSKQIVDAARELETVSRTIVDQTQTVSASTQEQSASTEQIASASKVLSDMAQELESSVKTFQA